QERQPSRDRGAAGEGRRGAAAQSVRHGGRRRAGHLRGGLPQRGWLRDQRPAQRGSPDGLLRGARSAGAVSQGSQSLSGRGRRADDRVVQRGGGPGDRPDGEAARDGNPIQEGAKDAMRALDKTCLLLLSALVSAGPAAAAANWPSFRGASASGNADGENPPVTWDGEKMSNVKWKT